MELRERYGPWALVTGAAGGIGSGFARALAARGFHCLLTDLREEPLTELARELAKQHGVETALVTANLAETEGVERVLAAAREREIGLLVNNAGFGGSARFLDQDPERLDEMIRVNCTAPMLLARGLLPAMVERGRGGMILVSSSAGYQPIPFHALYAGSKACSLIWGEGIWYELKDQEVDVLVLAPGTTQTDFQRVAGQDPHGGCTVEMVVQAALKGLGRRLTVTPGWWYWLRCWVTRFMPRRVVPGLSARFSGYRDPS